jgi:hypothetical protein
MGTNVALPDQELSSFERQLKSLEAPLKAELVERGLADVDAESAARMAVDELIRCSRSSDEYSRNDWKNIIVRMGGKTIVTPATSCVYEFLGSAAIATK